MTAAVVLWVLVLWCLASVPIALAAGRFLARHPGDTSATLPGVEFDPSRSVADVA